MGYVLEMVNCDFETYNIRFFNQCPTQITQMRPNFQLKWLVSSFKHRNSNNQSDKKSLDIAKYHTFMHNNNIQKYNYRSIWIIVPAVLQIRLTSLDWEDVPSSSAETKDGMFITGASGITSSRRSS